MEKFYKELYKKGDTVENDLIQEVIPNLVTGDQIASLYGVP